MNRSVVIAVVIGLVLCLYLLTGLVKCDREADAPAENDAATGKPVMTVEVMDLQALEIYREVLVTGKTSPSRSVDLKAEVAGRIVEVADLRGREVAEAGLIAVIELNDRQERLEQARAALDQARLEYDAAVRLQDRELRSASQVAQALSGLRGAEQMVRMMELQIENTRITAPFNGLLQERMVEVGDYVGMGDPVARILDLDPIIVEGQITEFQIENVKIGEKGIASLPDGRQVEGYIRYVANEANPLSRTFKVELELSNPAGDIPAGVTAKIQIKTDLVSAFRISPGLISISDEGLFGVKLVDSENRVQFVEADIVRFEPDAIWLSNLPETIRLITVGQGFTKAGDLVEVVEGTPALNEAAL